jgi:hypothetical protein
MLSSYRGGEAMMGRGPQTLTMIIIRRNLTIRRSSSMRRKEIKQSMSMLSVKEKSEQKRKQRFTRLRERRRTMGQ